MPYFEDVIELKDVALDDEVILSYLLSKADYFGFTGEKREINEVAAALEQALDEVDWRNIEPAEAKKALENKAKEIIASEHRDKGGAVDHWGQLYTRKLQKGMRKIDERDIANIRGKKTPQDILKTVREKHVLVLDISAASKSEKLSVFLSIAKHLADLMESKQQLNLAVLIDEAPQYAPFASYGIQRDTTEAITELCALGRSYRLSIILLSQGIAGEIGINAAVRRNLNTQFIGKIHPLDMEEAGKLLSQLNISPEFLVSLPEGHFYFLGKLNPSPIPLLTSFDIKST